MSSCSPLPPWDDTTTTAYPPGLHNYSALPHPAVVQKPKVMASSPPALALEPSLATLTLSEGVYDDDDGAVDT